jgi:hypothetical protein
LKKIRLGCKQEAGENKKQERQRIKPHPSRHLHFDFS